MIGQLPDVVLALFLIFCRVGTCLLVMPGVSSARIPAQVRLFLSFAVSLALAPSLLPLVQPLVEAGSESEHLHLIFSEAMIGFFIGMLGRSFMLALNFAGHVVANCIGMGQALGNAIEDHDQSAAITSFITMTATTLIFVLNLHAEIARALVASYSALQPSIGFTAQASLIAITDNLSEAFFLCLRISSPFIIYAVIVNVAIGLANKLTPTIPIYFISLPFVLAGGVLLFAYTIGDFLTIFMLAFQNWVLNG
ncbi:flagellar type III secretion system protein FliR [Jiella endophytica]|uniref:Flagellar type III secretion system protein FliR n=1 Tax=Jiella endophytica TaxID=2558362 RepID=A0A4Y8RG11_9HYPH|nr:flagellar biosynthetic protein FliR [Jiella endophytica]TFF21693.1 flagellar type III secretion system protein FliR [Jiella endophytica]